MSVIQPNGYAKVTNLKLLPPPSKKSLNAEIANRVTSGLYYKHITIINDDSRVIRIMLQVVVSPVIIILMTLEAPIRVIILNSDDSRGVIYAPR